MTQEVFNYEPIQGITVEEADEVITPFESMSQSAAISLVKDANPSDSMSESVTVVVT